MDEDKRRYLLEIWRKLAPGDRQSLIQYGDFLLSRSTAGPPEVREEPEFIPGPEGESSFQAIKRLRRCYAMMETDASLLDDATQLMTRRIFGATDAEVIPQMEALFAKTYQKWLASKHRPPQ